MSARKNISELSIRDFCDYISDPDQFSGGGAAAAVTAAAAASIALLVARLSDRRASQAAASSIEDSPSTRALIELVERFFQSGDRDLEVLSELLEAQRAARATGDRSRYVDALRAAAEEPLRLARDVALLIEIVSSEVVRASRFTVSDLGAAATLGQGAAKAALLTAEVNVALLRREPGTKASADTYAEETRLLEQSIQREVADVIVDVSIRISGKQLAKQHQL